MNYFTIIYFKSPESLAYRFCDFVYVYVTKNNLEATTADAQSYALAELLLVRLPQIIKATSIHTAKHLRAEFEPWTCNNKYFDELINKDCNRFMISEHHLQTV